MFYPCLLLISVISSLFHNIKSKLHKNDGLVSVNQSVKFIWTDNKSVWSSCGCLVCRRWVKDVTPHTVELMRPWSEWDAPCPPPYRMAVWWALGVIAHTVRLHWIHLTAVTVWTFWWGEREGGREVKDGGENVNRVFRQRKVFSAVNLVISLNIL